MVALRSGFDARRQLFIDDFKLHVETLFVAFILWISSSISIRNSKPWFLILALWFLRNIFANTPAVFILDKQQFWEWQVEYCFYNVNSFLYPNDFNPQYNSNMVSMEVSYKKKSLPAEFSCVFNSTGNFSVLKNSSFGSCQV